MNDTRIEITANQSKYLSAGTDVKVKMPMQQKMIAATKVKRTYMYELVRSPFEKQYDMKNIVRNNVTAANAPTSSCV